jgi:hypothetical protein
MKVKGVDRGRATEIAQNSSLWLLIAVFEPLSKPISRQIRRQGTFPTETVKLAALACRNLAGMRSPPAAQQAVAKPIGASTGCVDKLQIVLERALAAHHGVGLAERLAPAGVPCTPVLDVA